ncbi:hypothetical protein QOT17_013498 [Balamuthia mandrillaris]
MFYLFTLSFFTCFQFFSSFRHINMQWKSSFLLLYHSPIILIPISPCIYISFFHSIKGLFSVHNELESIGLFPHTLLLWSLFSFFAAFLVHVFSFPSFLLSIVILKLSSL